MNRLLQRARSADRRAVGATFGRFLVVGGISTAVHYLVLATIVELLHGSAVLGSGVGFGTGAVVSYLLNRRHTFRSDVPHAQAVSRFVLVLGVGLGLNLLLMHGFVDRLHWPYLFAQMLTTGIVLFWHFAGHALWSFAHRDGAPG